MARARQAADWDQTSLLASIVINAVRSSGSPPIRPEDLNPYRRRQPTELPLAEIARTLHNGRRRSNPKRTGGG